jgi:predicted ArsR family transcriptional regulator
MRWWERSIGGRTRGRVIALVRRGVGTVEELAAELRVTDNAVRAQLKVLEQEGIVHATGTRQGDGAGKPATVYEIAPTGETALSAAYAPVLGAVLEALADRVDAVEVDEILRDAGRRLAPGKRAMVPIDVRVKKAAAVLTALGAELDVERKPYGYQLRGYACPLSAVVRGQPNACHAVEELVASLVGVPVRECCDRTGRPRCRFDIVAKSA